MTLNVYILTYNRCEYLKKSIESVLNQTYKNFELYVLDNASDDNTTAVVNSFCDNRLHYIRHSENLGGYGNIVYAINHCIADCFVLFHDDDIMMPNLLEKEMVALEREKADLVSGQLVQINEYDEEIQLSRNTFRKKSAGIRYSSCQLYEKFLETGHYLVFPSILYRTSTIKDNCILPKEEVGPCLDVVFYFDILRAGGISYELPDVVVKYRVHAGQDSSINKYSMYLQLVTFLFNDKDYAQLFYKKRRLFYSVIMRLFLLDFWHMKIDKNQFVEIRKSFRTVMEIQSTSKIDYMFFFSIVFPRLTRSLYKIYKLMKSKRMEL